jgi:hypothetical protein
MVPTPHLCAHPLLCLQHGSADGRRAAAHGLAAVHGGTPREVLGLTGHAEAAVRIHALHAIGAA